MMDVVTCSARLNVLMTNWKAQIATKTVQFGLLPPGQHGFTHKLYRGSLLKLTLH